MASVTLKFVLKKVVENNWPDHLTIQRYLGGSLDKKLMHELEKRALEDPFLADALEGYSYNSGSDHGLSILQRQLHERISHQQENKKVFDLSWQRLSIAAAAAVMFITAGVLFWMNSQLPASKLAGNVKHVEVNITPVDSLTKDRAIVNDIDKKPPVANGGKLQPLHETENYNKGQIVKNKQPGAIGDNADLNAGLSEKAASVALDNQEVKSSPKQGANADQTKASKLARHDSVIRAFNSDQSTLSEVVVTRSNSIDKAYPADGWEAYNRYLQENISRTASMLKQKGKVLLALKIDEKGALTDIKVIKGLSQAADSLAIKFIKNGPAWKGSPDGKTSELQIVLDF
jgi:hypothetical protein